jgi:DNA-directed RNA polymerase subunit RPC12/RpoP
MINDLESLSRYLALTGYSSKEQPVNRILYKCPDCKRDFNLEIPNDYKGSLCCPFCTTPLPIPPKPESVAEAARRGFYGSPPPMDEGDDPR